MPHTHPGLTECVAFQFGVGWNAPGAVIWDDFQVVPEPASLVMLAAGGFVFLRRRRVV